MKWHGATKDLLTPLLKITTAFNEFEPDQSTVRETIYKMQEIQSLCDLAKITAVIITPTPIKRINDSKELTTCHLYLPHVNYDNRSANQRVGYSLS